MKLSEDDKRAILFAVRSGEPRGKVADRYGVTHMRVTQLCQDAGMPPARESRKKKFRVVTKTTILTTYPIEASSKREAAELVFEGTNAVGREGVPVERLVSIESAS